MKVKESYLGAIKTAQAKRREIEGIKEKTAAAAEQLREMRNSGKITESWMQQQMAELRQEEEQKIAACADSVREIGRQAVEIGKKEDFPNPKFLDTGMLDVLERIDLSPAEMQEVANETRFNPTMNRAVRSYYNKHPLTETTNDSGFLGMEETHDVKIKFPQLPSERAAILAKYTDSLAYSVASGYYNDQLFSNWSSHWNSAAIDSMRQIDADYEELGDLSTDFPVQKPEPKIVPVIW